MDERFALLCDGADDVFGIDCSGSRSIDLRRAAKTVNAAIGGRGGGQPEMIQGSAAGTRAEIEAFFAAWKGEN